ncbi:hypothetical protein BRARA_I02120 [Brassica rapa]|uniref:Uncharacterized protein n=1 Tax=Brassica campestris TaxID=3711 RepID=A0A397XVJ2_BRACM|nr:hypothetical protein BRARA_I02120 [Brassica rapa]
MPFNAWKTHIQVMRIQMDSSLTCGLTSRCFYNWACNVLVLLDLSTLVFLVPNVFQLNGFNQWKTQVI